MSSACLIPERLATLCYSTTRWGNCQLVFSKFVLIIPENLSYRNNFYPNRNSHKLIHASTLSITDPNRWTSVNILPRKYNNPRAPNRVAEQTATDSHGAPPALMPSSTERLSTEISSDKQQVRCPGPTQAQVYAKKYNDGNREMHC